MANELRVYDNLVGGLVEDNPLAAAATTLTSDGLASLRAIDSTNHAVVVFDPDGLTGAPYAKRITAHTAAAGTATVEAAALWGTARDIPRDTPWVHALTADDVDHPSAKAYMNAATNSTTGGTPTTIAFDTEVYDTHNALSGGTFTTPSPGIYFVASRIAIAGMAATERFILGVFVGATERIRGTDMTWTTGMGAQNELMVVGDLLLAAADAVTIRLNHVSGATPRALEVGNERNSFFSIRRAR